MPDALMPHRVATQRRAVDGRDQGQRQQTLGMAHGRGLGDHAAHRDPDEMRGRHLQHIHQAGHIVGQADHRVGADRRIALAVPAQVVAQHAIARRQVARRGIPQGVIGAQRMRQDHPGAVAPVNAHLQADIAHAHAAGLGWWQGGAHDGSPVVGENTVNHSGGRCRGLRTACGRAWLADGPKPDVRRSEDSLQAQRSGSLSR